MVESSNFNFSVERDDDSILSGSVNYSTCTESSDDFSVSDLSIPAEAEVLPYRFEPNESDSKSTGYAYGGEAVHGELDSLSPERVGNTDW